MKAVAFGTLCLAIFLPCVFGQDDCACTFPSYLSGDVQEIARYTSRTFRRSSQWYISFPDRLYRSTSSDTTTLFDLKTRRLYEHLTGPDGGCESFVIGESETTVYTYLVPPPCVPSTAVSIPTPKRDIVIYEQRAGNTSTDYRVELSSGTGNQCKLLDIFIDNYIATSTTEQFYIFTNVKEDSAKELRFYTQGLEDCPRINEVTLG